jgi:hypothetical protein
MPKEMIVENLFQKNKIKYLAIIFFTLQFSYDIKWFRLYHYRYALQKNHGIQPSFQRFIPASFDRILNNEYRKSNSFIKQCFNSRSNLIDHINKLVDMDLLEKKHISGENHYRLKSGYKNKIFYAIDCAWFNALKRKLPPNTLHNIKKNIESEFEVELKKYNAFYLTLD